MKNRVTRKNATAFRSAGLAVLAACFLVAACESPLVPPAWQDNRTRAPSGPVGPAQKLPEAPKAETPEAKAPSAGQQKTQRQSTQRKPSVEPPFASVTPPFAGPSPDAYPRDGPRRQETPPETASPAPGEPAPPAYGGEHGGAPGQSPGGAPQAPNVAPNAPPPEAPRPSLAPLIDRPVPSVSAEPEPAAPPPPMTTTGVRVAVLLPLSGPNAKIGQAMLNAAQLALFSFSEKNFELLVHDTKGTPDGAYDAAQLAIGDGARLIIGPLLSASVRSIAPASRAAGVPVVAFSSDKSVVGEGIFTLGFLPGAEVTRIVRYARRRGIERFAALAPDTAYGETVLETFREVVEWNGGTVMRVERYDPHVQDYAPLIRDLADYDSRRAALESQINTLKSRGDEVSQRALKRLENLQTFGPVPFEALLLADGGKRLQAIAALLPFYDIDPDEVRMLGTGQWDEPGIGREPALIDGWYAAPPPNARDNFENQYRRMYDRAPPRLATLAYDATALATVLARAPNGPDFSYKALTTPSGFAGRDGIFRLLPNGMPERGLAVLQVGPRQNKVISPAPDSFGKQAFN